MANKRGHQRFGNVRKLQPGRWQARYQGPDGLMRSAPETLGSKRDAEQWLTVIESDVWRGDWSDPLTGRVPLGDYGQKWIEEHKLSQRTRKEYDRLWRRHINPFLGRIELAKDLDRHHSKLANNVATRGPIGGQNGEGMAQPETATLLMIGSGRRFSWWRLRSGRPGSNRHGQLGRSGGDQGADQH